MKKKFLNFILIGVLTIGLTGCGNIDSVKETNQQNTNQEIKEEKPKSNDKKEQKKLGDTISLDFVDVTLDSLEVKDKYNFEYVEQKSYTYTQTASLEPKTSDFKLVSLRGNFTNKFSKEIYTANNVMYGIFEINGNEYNANLAAFNTAEAEEFYGIKPQQKVEYFYYAEVPANVADNITSCKIKFGFKKDFDVKVFSFKDLDYIYELNEIPTKAV